MILKISGRNVIRFLHTHNNRFKTNATPIQSLLNANCRVTVTTRNMVTLIVATTSDPASINPAAALLAMPGWTAGPTLPPDIKSFTNKQARVIQHDGSIVKEDDLDLRWEEATGEVIDEVIFLSRHTAVSNRPALTVHPIGVLHLKDGESPPQGGKPGWAALPNPRIGPWFRLLKKMAEAHGLVPEFEITLEATHHGPITNKPTMFLEIGSTDEYWKRQDAAQVMALLMWEGLGLGGRDAVGNWNSETGKRKVLLGIGGGHYAPRHMDIVLKDDIWVGHLLSGYSLPMEEPTQTKPNPGENEIGGNWRQSIKAAFEATKAAFPGGEILAHLDQKSFKGWQRKAITEFLAEESINVGKPNDFT
ncbi:PREDICTED: D-aminoacyl-tRNA deacylase [Camelina sativa]|uniref:D-aminoacyl-tRNA deacylase n=1 Tax=Camelina sativa TaxID=90675 RepID=A0ABM0TEH6_CAMSA|nr:PREDICTED: D-aminoacyl-tRNA deacylase [Camelina sativa]